MRHLQTLVPFVIGVTGHRGLRPADVPTLEAAVRGVFDQLRSRMPSTPLILLSALAEGADQLVARVALSAGVQLTAVLPMPASLYRSTLDASAQAPFDTLLAQASEVIELPLGTTTEDELRASPESRVERYEALALFLVARSQTLIALWDGVSSQKPGGTSQVVHYMLNRAPDESQQIRPVFHIQTVRAGTITQKATGRSQ